MSKNKGKKKVKAEKEDEAEDWCFVCKDGGKLLLCDFKGCGKAYHPVCVGKKNSVLKSEGRWTCCRHSCSVCGGPPRFYCLCCPDAVCRLCARSAEFVSVKLKKGLCKTCIEVALLAENNAEFNSQGVKMDFEDPDTEEFMFKGYLEIIMEQEDLTFDDLHRAALKKENYDSSSDSDKIEDEDAVVTISDGDSDTDFAVIDNSLGKRKKSEVREYVGWGSKPLINFLKSVGIDATEKLSKFQVDIIISKYILEKNLFREQGKKKTVLCDEKLYSLFQKKQVHKNKIYDLLEAHFVDTLGQSNSDENENDSGSCSGNEDEHIIAVCKKQRTLSTDKVPIEEKVDYAVQKNCYASIVAENIKLVYLRRSLVEELLMQSDNFEDKVVGSFVRVKRIHGNCSIRTSFQLLQVTGIKKTSNAKVDRGILLEVSCMPVDICIDMLNDGDISEEECEDLRQRMKDGLLRKPTIVELEQKAKSLHEDITKNWIRRQLVSLQNKIDFAHEKGRRYMLERFLDEREMLKKSSEQQRLLLKLPRVIAEEIEPDPTARDSSENNCSNGSGKLQCPAVNQADGGA
ncbi:PREDICTED: uncharacterized protein At5g08430 isoform X1 [Theobroma cacao]|uniref:Uncharacterized protein At5g08430 isoform X1 n=1 Tax=Theobroma cacao TaxID=3641 RepID=A0AB32WGF7_THECC|nr:PREDICTED: uncharacterized protein At5g08430 isoform X1 [Theobroma cacao]XP_017976916.1 PREDICTED: uncharacterized protein At5g08430 isoform X1 [Theobroma cacao]XP_017976917.1 PREDICTED: uncharacterized protein At5g08430 isoform X1 [Theobroma cacao]XP_017976918.1 PREDICTED: uncharacterized protein At5g08430 isoform X1 [Theobroma cacao]